MLTEIFKAFLITSLAGMVLTAVITLLKPVTKRFFSYSWHYYIWLAVLFVMLVPVKFTLPQRSADIPVVNTQSAQINQTAEAVPMNVITNDQNLNAADIAHTVSDDDIKTTAQKATDFIRVISDSRMNYLSILWLAGVIFFLVMNVGGYISLIRKIRKNSAVISCPEISGYTDKKITVRVGRNLSSPFMLGVFRPTLVLPDMELSGEQLNNILRHEMTHFKRRDILYKWLTLFVRSVHWFNPIVYYAARQINNECEISCDLLVVSKMNGKEQMSYVNTILSLVSRDRVKRVPLTTQMASGKRILKRRFTMIKNVKKTSKFMSVLSAVIAAAMLCATVFAGGILSGFSAEDGHTYIDGRNYRITPVFIENTMAPKTDSYYLPLRDIFEALGYMVNYDVDKSRYSGEIVETTFPVYDFIEHAELVAPDTGETIFMEYYSHEWKKPLVTNEADYYIYGATLGLNGQMPIIEMEKDGKTEYCQIGSGYTSMGFLFAAPTLIDGKAYIPIRAIAYLVGGTDNVKWNEQLHDTYYEGALTFDTETLTVNIQTVSSDSDGKNFHIGSEGSETPQITVQAFFGAFSRREFDVMYAYCTQKCVDNFFGNGYCFGMTQAELTEMNIDALEYVKSSNDFNIFVNVNMVPHENSVYESSQTSTSFYVTLQRQADGRYLIDEFGW